MTPADKVTLLRAGLGVVVALLVVLTLLGLLPERSWWLFAVLVPTFALDAVDGAVARRTGTATARGARFDMETDSAVVLVVSLAVAPFAPWALLIGLARYLFWLGALLRPAWRGALPFRQSRRVIAALQAVALAVALAPPVAVPVGQAATAVALALLVFSFARDIRHLERRAAVAPSASG
ncbi:Phosphatidylglycerophosphate synthase [Tessaracoccus oleiagri]|uniref:Phosphatidylglycerophosphate synthase n=1 Tax=Tessaracoccus oleiagri TaxID=686624 RepID=A0A1G9I3R1_9ACTN|nr:Phosphatidylglycerophosphate synthase [Tessaracoccus oleiagri]